MRFILTSDICGAWSSFGGIAAQLDNLSIILHLATTESITAALLYDGLLSAHLEELARSRVERSAAVIDFSELLSVEQTRFKLQAVAQATKKDPPVEKGGKGDKKKEKGLGPSTGKPQGWLPKQEYLAKLAADKAEAENKKKDTYRKTPHRR